MSRAGCRILLGGWRVAVVMAGNPYTDSGHRFSIPDMLANRADIYHLLFGGQDNNNQFGPVGRRLSGVGDELHEIREAIQGGLEGMKPKVNTVDSSSSKTPVILIQSSETSKSKKVSMPMINFPRVKQELAPKKF
jgi:hypothetical protein